MHIKLKAVLQTIAFFVVCILSASIAHFLPVYVTSVIIFALFFYLVYSLLLNRLEFDKKIQDVKNKEEF